MRESRRGDVIVFKYPDEPERDFIKRVIGLPGETLELRNKKVYVNGQPLDEPYVHFLEPAVDAQEVTSFDVRERYGPVHVPAEQYFVMGDNRDNSQDSRYWGFLPRTYIKGKALMIYWSVRIGQRGLRRRGRRRDRRSGCSRSSPTSSPRRAGSGCSTRFTDGTPTVEVRMIRKIVKLAVFLLIANGLYQVTPVALHNYAVQGRAAAARPLLTEGD